MFKQSDGVNHSYFKLRLFDVTEIHQEDDKEDDPDITTLKTTLERTTMENYSLRRYFLIALFYYILHTGCSTKPRQLRDDFKIFKIHLLV